MKIFFLAAAFIVAPCCLSAEETPPNGADFNCRVSIHLGKEKISTLFYKGSVSFDLSNGEVVPLVHLSDICKFFDSGDIAPVNADGEVFGGEGGLLKWKQSISKPRVEMRAFRRFNENGRRKIEISFQVLSDYSWTLEKGEGVYLAKGLAKIGSYTLKDAVFGVASANANASDECVIDVLGSELQPAKITLDLDSVNRGIDK